MNLSMRELSVAAPLWPCSRKGPLRLVPIALALLLAGCGQKGPLSLPSAAPAASAPAPGK